MDMSIDRPFELKFRQVLGTFATGVTVVTAADARGQPVGITVNSFSSLSLRPPMVLWSLAAVGRRVSIFETCRNYAINVLSEHQEILSRRFADVPHDEQFSGLRLSKGVHDVPLIDGCSAWIEVENTHRCRYGDHVLFIGNVLNLCATGSAEPLIFYSGKYRRLSSM